MEIFANIITKRDAHPFFGENLIKTRGIFEEENFSNVHWSRIKFLMNARYPMMSKSIRILNILQD